MTGPRRRTRPHTQPRHRRAVASTPLVHRFIHSLFRNGSRTARALLLSQLHASPALADLAGLCDAAAHRASRMSGVPVSVLLAISLTETGRGKTGTARPWPWTVNMEGKGMWFPDRDTALAYVRAKYTAGARSFDIGCFQLNHRWHGKAFASFEQMFQPEANALYAARFLKTLHDETGDWNKAAGAYHSRTPKYANRYIKRFERFHAALTGAAPAPAKQPAPPVQVAATQAAPRLNSYPLLRQPGAPGSLGSLVPVIAAGPGLFAPTEPQG